MASKKEFNEFMKKVPIKNYWLDMDDTLEVLDDEDPINFLYNEGSRNIYIPISLEESPKNPGKIEEFLKDKNPQLKSLVSHVVENRSEGCIFWEIAKNLPGDSQDNFREIENNYTEKLSEKPSIYENKIVSKDAVQKTIYEKIKNHYPNNFYTGIIIKKDSLKV